jgi:predicted DNA-binding transcriptional regulator AlpA
MTGTGSKTVRMIEIAELLGVSKQRAHQIAYGDGFPVPVAEDGRGRLWDRREVEAWAKRGRSVGAARSPGASRTADEHVRSASQDQP